MIVVTGATGQLGRLVIAALLKKMPASDIVAAVRNGEKARDIAASGVRVRLADYNQPQVWDEALKGADKVLLISASECLMSPTRRSCLQSANRFSCISTPAFRSIPA